MITNGHVTIKRGEKAEEYEAHLFERRGRESESGGAVYQNSLIVRIPTSCELDIAVDDWAIPDYAKDERSERRKIVEVTANFYGLNPHYKLKCE